MSKEPLTEKEIQYLLSTAKNVISAVHMETIGDVGAEANALFLEVLEILLRKNASPLACSAMGMMIFSYCMAGTGKDPGEELIKLALPQPRRGVWNDAGRRGR